jgi:GST-like protein
MIECFCVPTANGQKATILLEELGLDYEITQVDLRKGEHLTPEYLAMNPVGRAPTIVDRGGPGGEPLTVYGTLAIAVYLCEKVGELLPASGALRAHTFQWMSFIASDLSPAFTGQFIHGVMAKTKHEDVITHYVMLAHRMLKVMDQQLAQNQFLAGDEYTAADILAYPAAVSSAARLEGGLERYASITAWSERVGERPAVQRGMDAAGSM